ncbi:MAG: hypothetical protein JWP03_3333 [Phycisphaerales bacterium]|nr:hypothetical protein [Phycisphaerales bacterium]
MDTLSVVSCPLSVARCRRRSVLPATRNQQPATSCSFRPGFSFTEILFAVMILGIGFIMIAAMFPVAIKQTASTAEETVAAAIARSGADYLQKTAIPTGLFLPPTLASSPPAGAPVPPPVGPSVFYGQVWSFHDDRMANSLILPQPQGAQLRDIAWAAAAGNLLLPSDRRYAWVPMYRRDRYWKNGNLVNSNFAQVIVIATQVRNRSTYGPEDFSLLGTPAMANLQPRLLGASFTYNSNPSIPDQVTFTADGAGPVNGPAFVAEGAYVVVSDDTGAASGGGCNGYIYRVGNNISGDTWELAPGNDMKSATFRPINATGGPVTVKVLVVGRGYADPASGNTAPTGPAMDIAVYTTFIRVN